AALDREKPAAALLELEGTHALRGDPRVAVARARARVLQGDEHALSELDPDHKMLGDAIREAALAREVPPPLRADAALALLELALITGDEKVVGPALATLEQLAAGNDPPLAPPSAQRVALALAAPALDSAVSALAGAWSSEPGKARGVKQDELTGAVARLEPRALEGDIDAQALLLVLVGVGGKLARADTTQLAERVRAPAPREPSREVAIARALDLACSGLAVFERSRQNLDHALWSEDEKPVAGADDLYAATSSDRASASPLVLVARDRATQALAFRLRPGEHLLGRASSSADAHALVANASHILDVAGRREPFSPAVRRARAEVALAWAQVGPAASTKEASAAGRVEAAAAALLDPFDAASCAALARAHASCGDEARSRTWARRARAARRGALADHDAALVVALLSPENHSKDGEEIEERAWLEIVAGNMDVARSLVREAALLDDEERAAIAGGQPLAVGRLVPPTPDIRSRLAQARLRLQAQGTPWAELWAQASLSLESVIDDGLEVDGGQFSSVSDTPTGDAVNDLWRALGFVVQVEAAKESPASGAASARKLLESVVQARPRSLAPRVLADYVDILASPETGDVAEAAADLERLERIAWARGTLPALLSAARALAEARLLREGVPRRVREGEGRVRRLLERPSLAPSWNRWKLERGR
ncbi:hypothetical protein HY251_12965, partial [bacterium]|nr:hypothetical protein [bacterium]